MALNLNKNMSMAAVVLDIEKTFDITLHPGLLYELSKLHFSSSLIKLISSFLSNRKFRVMVEGNCPCLEIYEQGCYKFPSWLLPSTVFTNINDTPQKI